MSPLIFLDENVSLTSSRRGDKAPLYEATKELIESLEAKGIRNVYGVEYECSLEAKDHLRPQDFLASANGYNFADAVKKKIDICERSFQDENALERCYKQKILDVYDIHKGSRSCILPPKAARDEDIAKWCKRNNAILVTEDKGYMLPPPAKVIVELQSCRNEKNPNLKHQCVVNEVYNKLKNVKDALNSSIP